MTLCPDCVEYEQCKEICPAVKKEITGRGITASQKPKTYPVDFSYLDSNNPLNTFQIEVIKTISRITFKSRKELAIRLELEEAMNNCLNGKEKEVILFFMQNFNQRDIARRVNVSQPRVNFLLRRSLGKLKIYLLANGGYQK